MEKKEAALTPTEKEVVKRLRNDENRKQIASSMDIEIGTVNTHVANIYRKKNINSIGQLLNGTDENDS
jgi:DNA-binding CsgD family transcriptional regulator